MTDAIHIERLHYRVGNAFEINFYPEQIKFNSNLHRYTPNPFSVMSFVYNPAMSGFMKLRATQTASSDLLVLGNPTLTQDSVLSNRSALFIWKDSALAHSGSGTALDSIAVDLTATNLSQPAFASCTSW